MKDQENKGSRAHPLQDVDDQRKAMGQGVESRASNGGQPKLSEAERQRKLRTAAKLRENLGRRKQQARARRAGEAEDGEGLPAANSSKADGTAEE